MANATAFAPIDMPNMSVWRGEIVSYNSTTIVVSDGYRTGTYSGSFAYNYYGEVFGTWNGIKEWRGGNAIYEVTNIGADANTMFNAIQINGSARQAWTLALAGNDLMTGSSGGDHLLSFAADDKIWGKGGNDTLDGGTGNDTLFGGAGRDDMTGGSGADRLIGGGRGDTLSGGDGKDFLAGGKGHDVLSGGNQADTFFFKKDDGRDRITDFDAAVDTIKIGQGAHHFDQLKIVQKGDDAVVHFADVTIKVEHTHKTDLTADVFDL